MLVEGEEGRREKRDGVPDREGCTVFMDRVGGVGLLCAQRAHSRMREEVGLQFLFGHHGFCPGRPGGGEGGNLGDKTQSATATDSWCVLGTGPGAG